MPRLDAVPSGTALFIDANIFLGHFLRVQPLCTSFLERVWARELLGVTSVGVLAEVRHGLLRAETTARFHVPSRHVLKYLRTHPRRIAELTDARRALGELKQWSLRIVHVTRGQLWHACRISERFGLLTNDALHVAALRAHRLRHLASADRDFLHVPRLTVWTP